MENQLYLDSIQLGDIVCVLKVQKEEEVLFASAKVSRLDFEDCVVVQPGDGYAYEIPATCLRPILLSKEILEKNGFEYEKDYGSFCRSRLGDIASDEYVTIGWNSRGEMYNYEVATRKRVAYGKEPIAVHELQQLLRFSKSERLQELSEKFRVEI